MRPARKPRAIDWIGCGAFVLIGTVILGIYLHQRAHGTTPEDELTLAEGVAEDVTVTNSDGAFDLKFTVGGFRTEYSSKRPRYEEILAAVRGGQPVQAWVSTKQETLFPRRGWVPLYKLRLDGKIVLDYDTTVAEKADRDRPLLILGCIVLGVGSVGLVTCMRNRSRSRVQEGGTVGESASLTPAELRRMQVEMTAFLALTFYAIFIGTNFLPEMRAKFAEAFGPEALGLPIVVVVSLVETLLYLPMPWVIWHGVRIGRQALEDGRLPGLLYLLRVGARHPELRRSQRICFGGLIYFIALVAAWIIYTESRGI